MHPACVAMGVKVWSYVCSKVAASATKWLTGCLYVHVYVWKLTFCCPVTSLTSLHSRVFVSSHSNFDDGITSRNTTCTKYHQTLRVVIMWCLSLTFLHKRNGIPNSTSHFPSCCNLCCRYYLILLSLLTCFTMMTIVVMMMTTMIIITCALRFLIYSSSFIIPPPPLSHDVLSIPPLDIRSLRRKESKELQKHYGKHRKLLPTRLQHYNFDIYRRWARLPLRKTRQLSSRCLLNYSGHITHQREMAMILTTEEFDQLHLEFRVRLIVTDHRVFW